MEAPREPHIIMTFYLGVKKKANENTNKVEIQPA